jgi:glycosyltransferase involved in cell wall biosynthesis
LTKGGSLRVLMVHEHYRQPGGEDMAVAAEVTLLKEAGIEVELLTEDNRRISGPSLGLAMKALWSLEGRRLVADAIDRFRPDVLHVHNSFPLLSASIYGAAQRRGVAVVQTLHNFRLVCPNMLLLRDGRHCELCVDKILKWPGVLHACYRDSRAASTVMAGIGIVHRLTAIRHHSVDRYLALTPFSARRFIAGGLPADRLGICAPVVREPMAPAPEPPVARQGGLFVGRLSPEKGVASLLEAWHGMPYPLTIIGDGPLADELKRAAPPQARFLGWQPPDVVSAHMHRAALLMFPSLCYENFPLAVAEALAHGLPVLAATGGSVAETLEEGQTGAFAPPGDAAAWSARLRELLPRPDRLAAMGAAGLRIFNERYSRKAALAQRLALYEEVLAARAVITARPAPAR